MKTLVSRHLFHKNDFCYTLNGHIRIWSLELNRDISTSENILLCGFTYLLMLKHRLFCKSFGQKWWKESIFLHSYRNFRLYESLVSCNKMKRLFLMTREMDIVKPRRLSKFLYNFSWYNIFEIRIWYYNLHNKFLNLCKKNEYLLICRLQNILYKRTCQLFLPFIPSFEIKKKFISTLF